MDAAFDKRPGPMSTSVNSDVVVLHKCDPSSIHGKGGSMKKWWKNEDQVQSFLSACR